MVTTTNESKERRCRSKGMATTDTVDARNKD
ncbi:hypothetical protein A2U01_0072843, partial [Trifolium medium]|nr:hypothetical protein [Trifolium medium]